MAAAAYLTLGALSIYWAVGASAWWSKGLFLYAGLSFLVAATVYLLGRPALFGKRSDGSIRAAAWVPFGPFFVLNWLLLGLQCILDRGPAYQTMAANVLLGRRISGRRLGTDLSSGLAAVVDSTSEFPESPALRHVTGYLALPVLDRMAPDVKQLGRAAEHIATHARNGPVYVHCASGYGRSATVIAAYLLYTRAAADVMDAVRWIAQRRPGIGIRRNQIRALEQFAASLDQGAAAGPSEHVRPPSAGR